MKHCYHIFLGTWTILLYFGSLSDACSCLVNFPQNWFCSSSFVIEAKILKKESDKVARFLPDHLEDVFVYTVQIFKDYKNKHAYLGTRKIYTGSNSAACGVNLKLNEVYLLSGGIRDGIWWTGLCNWYTPTSSLTPFQLKSLKFGIYEKNCECTVTDCSSPRSSCPPTTKDVCLIRNNRNCFWERDACVKRGGKCTWKNHVCVRQTYRPGK